MKITKIVGEACKTARSLWEEVFYEDSVQFTDYYFENKAIFDEAENRLHAQKAVMVKLMRG